MNLYLLRPRDEHHGPWEPWFDKVFGFVVRADTEAEARAVADTHGGDENDEGHPWLDAAWVQL